MSNDETNRLLKRIAYALETVAATLAAGFEIEQPKDDGSVFGTVVEVSSYGGGCRVCGCQLIAKIHIDDGRCPACDEYALGPDDPAES